LGRAAPYIVSGGQGAAAHAFRSAGYMAEQFDMLLGHTKTPTTGRYGILLERIMSEHDKMIEAAEFLGLNVAQRFSRLAHDFGECEITSSKRFSALQNETTGGRPALRCSNARPQLVGTFG
jgi:hypothetical protein